MVKRVFGFILFVAFAGAFLLYYKNIKATSSASVAEVLDTVQTHVVEHKEPKVLYGMVLQDDHVVIEDKIKRNQFLGDILEEYNVPARLIHQVSQLSRKVFDPRKLAPNSKYTLICNQDSITKAKAFVYEPNPID